MTSPEVTHEESWPPIVISRDDFVFSVDDSEFVSRLLIFRTTRRLIASFVGSDQFDTTFRGKPTRAFRSPRECVEFTRHIQKFNSSEPPRSASKTARKKAALHKQQMDSVLFGGQFLWACLMHNDHDVQATGVSALVTVLDSRSRQTLGQWIKFFISHALQHIDTFARCLPFFIVCPTTLTSSFFPTFLSHHHRCLPTHS